MARRAARTDANQKEVVAALRKAGATVFPTHMVGKGFPDIVVGFRGVNHMIEIKDGSKPPSARALTDDEQVFHDFWLGKVDVCKSVNEALSVIGLGPAKMVNLQVKGTIS